MEEKPKKYGCLVVIAGLFILYIALYVIKSVTDTLGHIFSNPIINYGIPIGIIVFGIIMANKEKK